MKQRTINRIGVSRIKTNDRSRILYIDILRVVSIFAVVVLHISAPFVANIYTNGVKSWWVGNIINSATRWSVPVLIIISGKLMLDNKKEEKIVPFLAKRLCKIIIPLVFWSFIYMVITNKMEFKWTLLSFLAFCKKLYIGDVHIHLWYLYMIVGLYLITPIIKVYVNNAKKSNLIYFIVIWFIVNGVIGFSEKFSGYSINFNLSFFHWSIGYYVLGFILDRYELSKRGRRTVHFLGVIGLIITMYATYIFSLNNEGVFVPHIYSNYAPNVIFTSISVFLLFKTIDWNRYIGSNTVINRIISSFSSTSFGVYLSHLFVLRIINSGYMGISIEASSFHPIIGIPLVSLITFLLSHILVKILQKIPFVNTIVP